MRHGGNVWEGQPADWLDFSANLRPEGTPAWVMDTMRAALSQACYYPDRAMRAARAGLALYLGVDESCVLPTAGGAAAIDLTLGVRRGAVHVQPPTFGEYAERAKAHGRRVAANQARAERFARGLQEMGVRVTAGRVPFLLADFGRDMTTAVQHLWAQHILVRTCDSFGLPANYLRLAVKTDAENDLLMKVLYRENFDAR